MKIINISGNTSGLTVDTTLITVDTTLFTVDLTNTANTNTFTINITPRFYVDEVNLRIKNEMTELVTNQVCTHNNSKWYYVY